ncbi:MAG: helix-turn-helix transcriptional regulator [Bauldia sp.]|nr:helix-turn-helix transcriptional regulator [Bauldia sp.]
MLSHRQIWGAIDRLAERNKLTASGLARRAGLDPTTFNRSKRVAADGRERWPSTESISKILHATGTPLGDFLGLVGQRPRRARNEASLKQVPLLGLAQAGAGGFFDDGGFPAGQGWEQISYPGPNGDGAYALEVTGDSMTPLYRDGDIIIVSPSAECRRGDRVVVKTTGGEVMAKVLQRKTSKVVELASLNPAHPDRSLAPIDIEWMARIIWASQ